MQITINDWIEDFSGSGWVWYLKRLSGNDTLANGSHQAGPYMPKDLLFLVFPSLNRPEIRNPDVLFNIVVDSHSDFREIRAVWYNNRLNSLSGTRNEARLTGFGGSESALLDPENTGALTVFAFLPEGKNESRECHIWVCRDALEEEYLEDITGPIEPGKGIIWTSDSLFKREGEDVSRTSCRLMPEEIPVQWYSKYPAGNEVIAKTIEMRPFDGQRLSPDNRLIRRRRCEYEIYQSLEEAVELPLIKKGFNSIESFISLAQTILQRRKSRSGHSLELHTRNILIEENFIEGTHFSFQPESEDGKTPDFLFPSELAYKNPSFPDTKLRMLALKTTCKDRWRQILNEADRIKEKHLLTLQEGVSENQYREMILSNVRLVVPSPLVSHYPQSIREHLISLESFIGDLRLLAF